MFTTPRLTAIALCAALNIALGSIVYLLKLPLYLDSIGTILCALLLAPDRKASFLCAWVCGWSGILITGVLINPYLPFFAGTDIAIALTAAFLTTRFADLARTHPIPAARFAGATLLCGVVTGLVSAIVSAPVVAYLFGGVTGNGSAFVVAFFLKSGQQLIDAVLLSGLTAEPVDKTLQVLVAFLLYRATPRDFIMVLRPHETAPAAAKT